MTQIKTTENKIPSSDMPIFGCPKGYYKGDVKAVISFFFFIVNTYFY